MYNTCVNLLNRFFFFNETKLYKCSFNDIDETETYCTHLCCCEGWCIECGSSHSRSQTCWYAYSGPARCTPYIHLVQGPQPTTLPEKPGPAVHIPIKKHMLNHICHDNVKHFPLRDIKVYPIRKYIFQWLNFDIRHKQLHIYPSTQKQNNFREIEVLIDMNVMWPEQAKEHFKMAGIFPKYSCAQQKSGHIF